MFLRNGFDIAFLGCNQNATTEKTLWGAVTKMEFGVVSQQNLVISEKETLHHFHNPFQSFFLAGMVQDSQSGYFVTM